MQPWFLIQGARKPLRTALTQPAPAGAVEQRCRKRGGGVPRHHYRQLCGGTAGLSSRLLMRHAGSYSLVRSSVSPVEYRCRRSKILRGDHGGPACFPISSALTESRLFPPAMVGSSGVAVLKS
ncbi:hypothetical protein SETIT_9G259200v2 [Setaria italica]|uniref:Uncharacterized protein n=1 Tax=Setaria italica TaxID=4555 RepID=A0A368SKR0_SETIT|nr:hypothetical protein SETIT_9G259200v2 [Setaria italica]